VKLWLVFVLLLATPATAQYFPPQTASGVNDFDVFPPRHSDHFHTEIECGGGPLGTAGSPEGWLSGYGPTGTGGTANATNGRIQGLTFNTLGTSSGLCQFSVGTTATNYTNMYLAGQGGTFDFANGTAKFFAAFDERTPSDTSNTYTIRLGFVDSTTTETSDGCFFRYTNGVNSGKWELVSHKNDALPANETALDSGLTYTLGTRRTFGIKVEGAVTCTFYNNNTVLGVIDTNVPTGNNHSTNAGIVMLKTLGPLEVYNLNLDYMAVEQRPAVARNWQPF
jgi:hypothetical protein